MKYYYTLKELNKRFKPNIGDVKDKDFATKFKRHKTLWHEQLKYKEYGFIMSSIWGAYWNDEITESKARELTRAAFYEACEGKQANNSDEQVLNILDVSLAVCVNCDEEKETHSICSDCLTKIINKNKQTES